MAISGRQKVRKLFMWSIYIVHLDSRDGVGGRGSVVLASSNNYSVYQVNAARLPENILIALFFPLQKIANNVFVHHTVYDKVD